MTVTAKHAHRKNHTKTHTRTRTHSDQHYTYSIRMQTFAYDTAREGEVHGYIQI